MYFPYFYSPVAPSIHYHHHISRLEGGLSLALDMLQAVVDRLESRFGEDLFSDQSRSPSIIQSVAEAEQTVDKLDELVKNGQQNAVLRELRAEFSLTWDQAQGAYSEWGLLSRIQKLRRIRLVRWLVKAGVIEAHD